MGRQETYTPRTTDQARQPPSWNGERGTASEVVWLDSKSASIELFRSSRSLCFSYDIISCDPEESVIEKLKMPVQLFKNYHVFVLTNSAVENIGYKFGAALQEYNEPLEGKSTSF